VALLSTQVAIRWHYCLHKLQFRTAKRKYSWSLFIKEHKDRMFSSGKNIIPEENCAILSSYAASSGNVLPTFGDNISILPSWVKIQKENLIFGFLTVEDENDSMSRNVGKDLPPLAAW
jgi:hypothetical protein